MCLYMFYIKIQNVVLNLSQPELYQKVGFL
jgi:hypothetical protein